MNIFKRSASAFMLAVLLMGSLFAMVGPQEKAHAAGPEALCVPKTKNSGEPDGWLRVEFVNRATIKVQLIPSGNCKKPSDRAMQYLVSEVEFAPLVSGTYYDADTGDGKWDYRQSSGGNDKDDNRVDQFSNQKVEDKFKGNDKPINEDLIKEFIKNSELTIGIEEDSLKGAANCAGEAAINDNFVLHADGDSFKWSCDDDIGSKTGLRIKSSFINLLNYNVTYNYDPDSDQIIHVSKGERATRTFKYCPGERSGQGAYRNESCTGDLFIEASSDRMKNLGNNSESFVIKHKNSSDTQQIRVAGATSESAIETRNAQGGGSATSGTAGDPALSCESLPTGLTWIICPIVTAANEVTDQLDNFIIKELNVDEDQYFNEEASDDIPFYEAWSNFRNLGLIMLVLVALVMVVSQALSVGPFDAYTVKKVLPRILIAVIFMTLSWDICKFLIALSNNSGAMVRTVIQLPFKDIDAPSILGGTGFVGTGLIVYAGISLGILGLLSFAASAFLAVIIAFIVLTLRKMIILLLVLLAPIAIAAYILPNTQKIYKLWWDTFSKALLMFPIIMGFIAVGRVFAKIAGPENGANATLLDQVVMIVAYYAPYFLMPLAFRLAGGAIATIAGMANDRSRGVFDRLKKGRQERVSNRLNRAGSEGLWDRNNRLVKTFKLNKAAGWAVAPHKSAAYYARGGIKGHDIPGLSKYGRRIESGIEHSGFEQTMKLFQELNSSIGSNDKAYRVLGGLHSGLSAETREKFERAGLVNADGTGKVLTSEKDIFAASKILSESDSHTEQVAASALNRAAPKLASLHTDPDMNYASVAAASAVGLGVHGFVNNDDIVNIGNNIKAESGSAEFADAMLVQTELAVANSMPHLKAGYGHVYDSAQEKFISGKDAGRDLDVVSTFTPGSLAGAKGGHVGDMEDTYKFIVGSTMPDETVRPEITQLEGTIKSRQDAITSRLSGSNLSPQDLQARIQSDPDVQAARVRIEELKQNNPVARAQAEIEYAERELRPLIKRQKPTLSDVQVEAEAKKAIASEPKYKEQRRTIKAAGMAEAFKQQQLFSAASRYSQAPVDTKQRVMKIIDEVPGLRHEFEVFEGRAQAGDAEAMSYINAGNAAASQSRAGIAGNPAFATSPPRGQGPPPGGFAGR